MIAGCGGQTEDPGACEVHQHDATHSVDLDESLYHSPSVYTVQLRLGSQEIDFVADTGSSNLIVRGGSELCPGCSGSEKERYQSAAGQAAGSTFSVGYGSGSGSVSEFTDSVGLACGDPVDDYTFGVITENQGLPNVLGLAYKSLAHTGLEPFFDQLVARHGLTDEFSMLLCGRRSGSHVTFGGRDSRRVEDSAYRWVGIVEERYYAVSARSLKLDDGSAFEGGQNELSFPASGTTIVDSGTTLSLLPAEVLDPLVATLKQAASTAGLTVPDDFWTATDSSNAAYKHSFSAADLAHFPTLQVLLEDSTGNPAAFEVVPDTYFKALYTEADERVFGFRPAGALNILGQVFMENGLFVFDRANRRIGIAPNDGLCAGG